jgi:hypothetical protein
MEVETNENPPILGVTASSSSSATLGPTFLGNIPLILLFTGSNS